MAPASTLSREVRNARSGATVSTNFRTVGEITFGDEILYNGQSMLVYDSGDDDPLRLLIFSCENLINFARTCTEFAADGTFKACPRVYNTNNTNGQLWTIHGYKNGVQVPIFFCLMRSRTVLMYKKVLEKTLVQNSIIPQKFMVDFEKNEINAIRDIFQECRITGCYFHFQGVIL